MRVSRTETDERGAPPRSRASRSRPEQVEKSRRESGGSEEQQFECRDGAVPSGRGRAVSRRWVLRGAGASAAALAGGGAAGSVSAQADDSDEGTQRPDFGEWLSGIDGGSRDARGEDSVTVLVGAEGNGGPFAFSPAGLWIDPGTTVQFRWTGDGGAHNVVAEEGPAALDSGEPVDDQGVLYEFTFEENGITDYYCDPHLSVGMKGAVAVGDDVPTVTAETGGGEEAPGFFEQGQNQIALIFYGLLGIPVAAILLADMYIQVDERGGIRGPDPDTPGSVAREATTWLGHRGHDLHVDGSIPAALSGPTAGPRVLDNLTLWTIIAVVLVVLAYGLPLFAILSNGLFAPGTPPVPA